MKTRLIVSCAMLVVAGSCFAQAPTTQDFFPLKVGTRWTYRAIDVKLVDANEKEDEKKQRFQKVVVEVAQEELFVRKKTDDKGQQTIEKHTGFLMKATSGGKTTLDHVVLFEDGIHRVHAAGTPITPPLNFLKLSKSWSVNSTSGNTIIKGTYTATANQKIIVPYKKTEVDTILVSFRDVQQGVANVEIDYWFEQGVGMVKQRVKAKNRETILELEQFEPAK